MGGGIILLWILAPIYAIAVLYVFNKHKNIRPRIAILVFPFALILCIITYGLLSDFFYFQKLKSYPEYTHIRFVSPTKDVQKSIADFKSVLNLEKWPFWMEGKPIPFEDLLKGDYIRGDSIFTNDSIGINNIRFLQMNNINSFELIGDCVFVTYRDSLSKAKGFYYELLQLKDVAGPCSKFYANRFDTIDYKDGLYLLIKRSLN